MSKVFTAKSAWDSVNNGFNAIGRWIYAIAITVFSFAAAIVIGATTIMIVWKIIQWAWS